MDTTCTCPKKEKPVKPDKKNALKNALDILYSPETKKVLADVAMDRVISDDLINIFNDWANRFYNLIINLVDKNNKINSCSADDKIKLSDIKKQMRNDIRSYFKNEMILSIVNDTPVSHLSMDSECVKNECSRIVTSASKKICNILKVDFVKIQFE